MPSPRRSLPRSRRKGHRPPGSSDRRSARIPAGHQHHAPPNRPRPGDRGKRIRRRAARRGQCARRSRPPPRESTGPARLHHSHPRASPPGRASRQRSPEVSRDRARATPAPGRFPRISHHGPDSATARTGQERPATTAGRRHRWAGEGEGLRDGDDRLLAGLPRRPSLDVTGWRRAPVRQDVPLGRVAGIQVAANWTVPSFSCSSPGCSPGVSCPARPRTCPSRSTGPLGVRRRRCSWRRCSLTSFRRAGGTAQRPEGAGDHAVDAGRVHRAGGRASRTPARTCGSRWRELP